jgi:hypothetical protein
MIAIGNGQHGFKLPPIPPHYTDRRRKLPRWAKRWSLHAVFFSYEEREWRIVSEGSHNNTPERARWDLLTRREKRIGMFVEYAVAIPVEKPEERLSESYATMPELAESLSRVMQQGCKFTPDMLARATHIKGRYA